MQFLKEIRAHLQDFETEVSDELHRFIDYLHTKYPEVKDAVVQPPAPTVTAPEATFVAPVLDIVEQPVVSENVTNSDTPVSADPATVVDTPVVDPTPAPQPDPEPAPSKE